MTSLFAILDHTRSRRGGPNLMFKFDFGILITFGYIAILLSTLELAYKAPKLVKNDLEQSLNLDTS